LADFVRDNNHMRQPGSPDYIHNLADATDLQRMVELNFKIDVRKLPNGMKNLYTSSDEVAGFVDRTLAYGSTQFQVFRGRDHARWAMEIGHALGSAHFNSAMSISGKNPDDHEFEMHLMGKEIIVPLFFDGLMILANQYEIKSHQIDRSTARLAYMPRLDGNGEPLMYILDKQTGHYRPSVVGIMEVFNTHDTHGPLRPYEEHMNEDGRCFVSGDTILASDRGAEKTTAKVVGESPIHEIIARMQVIADREIRPALETLTKE